MSEHSTFLLEALKLARLGRGWTSPNPVVGAVVVKDGAIVGRGWHKAFGGPHAEVFALQEAGERARGATLYCTLEPCTHTGKTPPCTQAVIKAGISTVVLGARDPNPVAAGGVASLRSAGITVITGVCENECHKVNAPFLKHVATGLPLVTVKWAMTADGKIATPRGESKWITGEPARASAHVLRGQHDAVLVGIGTVLADRPSLNCRHTRQTETSAPPAPKQPRRVILDTNARAPLDAPLWSVADAGPVVIVCGAEAPSERVAALRAKGAEVIALQTEQGRLPIRGVLAALGARGVLSVLIEGGSQVLGAVLDARLADMACVFVAPRIIGGKESVPAVGGAGVGHMADALNLQSLEVCRAGRDVLISGTLSPWEYDRQALHEGNAD
jgi:diaminohydroxyphosphoribosylaminopyrimidine deaminase/5-amino-6-(5-phosphoribosylamino)uracil reductase